MTKASLAAQIRGKEVHVRLVTNDLLEKGRLSVIAVGTDSRFKIESKSYTQYPPQTILGALLRKLARLEVPVKEDPAVVVIVEEKNGSVSADDIRYVEWLSREKGVVPRVVMLPELGERAAASVSPGRVPDLTPETQAATFWMRQWRRIKAIPAPITKDAALAAIPRTCIPVGFSLFLAYLKHGEVPLERAAGYIGLAFAYAIGFALFNQTVLNFVTFWSEMPRDAFEPFLRGLEKKASSAPARYLADTLSFVSARGDVFIAAPMIGIGCVYFARLALGPVGQTVSVLTWYGFFLVFSNVLVGSIAGGPYTQVVAHLRAVGKISNRTSMYLGIVETVKMELGRLADFGMQTIYNSIQLTLAVVFWVLLLVVDRCFQKPKIECLMDGSDIEFVSGLFRELRGRADAPERGQKTGPVAPALPILECAG